jgi:hypothetical protein
MIRDGWTGQTRRLTFTVIGFIAFMVVGVRLFAAGPGTGDTEFKAAFIVNVARFVDWPQSAFQGPASPLIITVVDADSIADELERAVRGKSIGNRQVVIRREKKLKNVSKSHLVFLGGVQANTVGLENIQGPVLTIGESKECLTHGVGIFVFFDDDKLAFEINAITIQAKGLHVSSRLLSLARKVTFQP